MNTKKELQKLHLIKNDRLYERDEVCRAIRIIEEIQEMDFVLQILMDKEAELTNEINKLHNEMFPKG